MTRTMNDDALLVCTTVADAASADALAERLVGERLAACVQIVPGVRSVYRWRGAVHRDDEVQLVIKTTAPDFDAVERCLRAHHPYELPEIVALPVVRGSAEYLGWIAGQTDGGDAEARS